MPRAGWPKPRPRCTPLDRLMSTRGSLLRATSSTRRPSPMPPPWTPRILRRSARALPHRLTEGDAAADDRTQLWHDAGLVDPERPGQPVAGAVQRQVGLVVLAVPDGDDFLGFAVADELQPTAVLIRP